MDKLPDMSLGRMQKQRMEYRTAYCKCLVLSRLGPNRTRVQSCDIKVSKPAMQKMLALPQHANTYTKVSYTKNGTLLTNTLICHHLLLFSSRSLGFVCALCICCVKWLKMKEWSLLVKQVFSLITSWQCPIWCRGAAATDSLPSGEQTLAERLTGKNGMGWELRGMSRADIILTKTTRLELVSRKKKSLGGESLKLSL